MLLGIEFPLPSHIPKIYLGTLQSLGHQALSTQLPHDTVRIAMDTLHPTCHQGLWTTEDDTWLP